MKRLFFLCLLLLGAAVALASLALPAAAAPNPQAVYFTPTPRPDGRIVYIVKKGDTCISIMLLHKITEDQLRQLNNIRGTNCVVVLGQEILIGYGGPAESPTPGPSPTPTPLLPTSTPLPGKGVICVVLFNDINGNSQFEENEAALPGGEVSVTNKSGSFSKVGATLETATTPLCFADVIEGEYTITVAMPQGYNATTTNNRTISLKAGDTSTLDFGAQVSIKAPPVTNLTPESTSRVPLYGVLGVVLILAGIGLAVYLRRSLR